MAKKNTPVITYTEILCRAIRSIENELKENEKKFAGIPGGEAYLKGVREELTAKQLALETMYRIETGTDYI